MAKPFLNDDQKQSLLLSIAKGNDPKQLACQFQLTEKQINKYRYNHKLELVKVANEHFQQAYCEDLPPLDRAKRVFGNRLKTKYNRFYLDKEPVTIKEIVLRANVELIKQGKKLIYYPGIVEPTRKFGE